MSRRRGSRGDAAQLPFFAPARPRVLAHRGLTSEAPENTLLAFVHALAVGAIYLESDVRASSDGVAMLVHDEDLLRVAGIAAEVRSLTLDELKRIELGDGQVMPTLLEALEAFPDAFFNIDIKAADAVQPTVAAILRAKASHRVLVTSFDGRRRSGALRMLPRIATSASSARFVIALLAGKLRLLPIMRLALRGIDAVQVPERALGLRITTKRMVRRFHRAGVEVHVWTVNDVAAMTRLLDIGVDGLVTDRADLALDLVEQRARR